MRFTVEDAAAAIGMTTGAVRNRLSQGTLRSVEEHGTVYVLLPADTSRDTARDTGDIPGEFQFLAPADTSRNTAQEETAEELTQEEHAQELARDSGDIPGESSALMSEMGDRIAFLEREREESSALVSEMVNRIASLERELERIERELERKDAILLNIGEAMKDTSSPTEQPGRVVPHEQPLEGAQEEPAEELTQEPAQEEAPSVPPEAPKTATPQPGPVEPRGQIEDAQVPVERRSWWSRIFGG